MKQKFCRKCNTLKCLDEFHKDKNTKDGYMTICIYCKEVNRIKYSHTLNGVVNCIYSQQKRSSKHRGHYPPLYSFDEFYDWITKGLSFNHIFDNWENSGYMKKLKPSVDRLDDTKGYSLGNIRLVTWEENNKKSHKDMITGFHLHPKSKTIIQLTEDGNYLNEYHSIQEAKRKTNIQRSNIYKVCNGLRKTAGGFKWMYKTDYNQQNI